MQDCIGAQAGQTLLIVSEPPGGGCYDDEVSAVIAREARRLGVDTSVLQTRTATGPDDIPLVVSNAMQQVRPHFVSVTSGGSDSFQGYPWKWIEDGGLYERFAIPG